jgi:hypothetical protein
LNNSQGVTIFSDTVPGNSSTNVDVIPRATFIHPTSSVGGGSRFDIVDEEMLEIHKKFRAFITYLQNETGFMNALTADILWKSLYVKYEQCFVKLQRRFEKET